MDIYIYKCVYIYIYPLSIHLWMEDTNNSNETELAVLFIHDCTHIMCHTCMTHTCILCAK